MINTHNSGFNPVAMEAMRQNRFKKTDQNADGTISKEELQARMPQNGKGPSVDDIFSKVDTNQDGVIDEAEDKAAFSQMKTHGHHRGQPDAAKMASAIFKKADIDEDGSITKEELQKVLPNNKKGFSADNILKALDADQSGAISKSELEDSIKQLMDKLRNPPTPPPPPPTAPETSGSYDSTGTISETTDASSSFSSLA